MPSRRDDNYVVRSDENGYIDTEHMTRSQRYHQRNNKPKKKGHKLLWLVIVIVVAIIGGFYAYRKYTNAKQAANAIYSSTQVTKARNVSDALKKKRPISILLMGTDTGALGRDFKGRTDTMILCVLNPEDKKMTLVSLPRDTEVAVYGYEDYFPSKINSTYEYGGSATAVKTVQKFLNVPIDFYATINMGGLEKLIDAVGGVKVEPTISFTYDGYTFKKGKEVNMDGEKALAYVRMRHEDPRGDYGRQERQRQVLTKLAFKSSGLTSLVNQKFLSTISKQMKTDLTFDDLLTLGTKYRVATHDMDSDFLQGTSEMINGESFEVASTTEKQRITNKLREALGLSKAKTGNTLSSDNDVNISSEGEDTNYSNDDNTYYGGY
ncbi:LCP family protein [Ligilactobacillus salivarius]|uniref:LCP family glycopolymer transferase n=1 Tax=Ligilactobacillus salivarius TaxID=1624 RepID=UPI001370AC8B|nr:LCP family protein [Ligilactobacillus salivarius]MYU89330.1 LytR family transcriptional regulator [Ligilactobacillus salivarius]